jgi:glucosamine--fructose-6-phosphate aminotransferase (isomerizing)
VEENANYELLADDIRRQPRLIADSVDTLRALAADVAGRIRHSPSRIYLVGCGDSLDAGLAVRYLWEQELQMPVEAVPALSFSRYLVNAAAKDALVVALSQSGKVTRVVESVRVARGKGLETLTITGSQDSALAQEPASARIITPFPKIGPIPGTTSYTYNMALLFELGAAFADSWSRGQQSDRTREQISSLPSLIEESLDPVFDVAQHHAKDTATREIAHLFLGAGPNFATARFAARKLFEVPQLAAMAQETEEYAHDQYSLVGENAPVFLSAPAGVANVRNEEIVNSLLKLKSRLAVVTERKANVPPAFRDARWCYEVAQGLDELLSPLLHGLPGQVYCYELAKILGGSFYASADSIHRSEGDPLIYDSQLIA